MNCKSIVFVEDLNNPGTKKILEIAKVWYELNKENIFNIHGIFTVIEDKNSYKKYRIALVIHYEGEGGNNPYDCIHEHQETLIIDQPRCEHEGTNHIICNDCHMVLDITHPEALKHNYEWLSNNDASCLIDGTLSGTCLLCGNKITKLDPNTALGHDYIWSTDKAETCLTDRIEIGICSRCNDTINKTIENTALGHEYPKDWITRIPATEDSDGIEFKKCIRCDNEITQIIPKLKHKWISNNDGTHTCITDGGCGVTENCYPNEPGNICDKCGYKTPENTIFEITTDFINGMIVDNDFNQNLECTITSGVTWSVESGNLPNGIALSSDGILSGIPLTSGIYKFTINASYNDRSASKEFSVNVANTYITIIFNPCNGTASETSRRIAKGSTIGTLPTATRDEYVFGGWFTAESGGMKVDENYSVSSDITLYARWGQGTDLEFGDATSQFNMQYNGDRTNYNNNPYTFYSRYSNGAESNLIIQTAISSINNDNNMTDQNKTVKLYMKVTNNGEAGNFDIGFDCDSYVSGDDCLYITRIDNGVSLGSNPVYFTVTVPYTTAIWVGKYTDRTTNRYNNVSVGTKVGKPGDRAGSNNDTGYAFTMKDIFINNGSYTILEVTFQKQ